MAERRTLLSQVSKNPGALQPGNVDAPNGAFGNYSGLNEAGRALQQVGAAGADVAARKIAEQKHKMEEMAARNINAQYSVAVREGQLAMEKDLMEAKEKAKLDKSPLIGTALTNKIEGNSEVFYAPIRKRMETLRKQYPELVDKYVTKEVMEESWSQTKFGYVRQGFEESAHYMNQLAVSTQLENQTMALKQASISPQLTAQTSAGLVNEIMDDPRYELGQKQALRADVQGQTYNNLSLAIADPEVEKWARQAHEHNGLSTAQLDKILSERKAYVAKYGNGGNTTDAKANLSAQNNAIASGKKLDFTEQEKVNAATAKVLNAPGELAQDLVAPTYLSHIQGAVRINTLSGVGASDNTVISLKEAARITMDPESAEAQALAWYYLRNTAEGLGSMSQTFSDLQEKHGKDFGIGAKEVRAVIGMIHTAASEQQKLVDAGRAAEVYQWHPKVQAAQDSNVPGEFVAAMRDVQLTGGVDEWKLDINDPRRLRAMEALAAANTPQSLSQLVDAMHDYHRLFGKDARNGLLQAARAGSLREGGANSLDGLLAIMGESSTGENYGTPAQRALITTYANAISFTRTQRYKDLLKDKETSKNIDQLGNMVQLGLSVQWGNKDPLGQDEALKYLNTGGFFNRSEYFKDPGKAIGHDFPSSMLGRYLGRQGTQAAVVELYKAVAVSSLYGDNSGGLSTETAKARYDVANKTANLASTVYRIASSTGTTDKKQIPVNLARVSAHDSLSLLQQESANTYPSMEDEAKSIPRAIDASLLIQQTGGGFKDSILYPYGKLFTGHGVQSADFAKAGYFIGSQWDHFWSQLSGAHMGDFADFNNMENLGTAYYPAAITAQKLGFDLWKDVNLESAHVLQDQWDPKLKKMVSVKIPLEPDQFMPEHLGQNVQTTMKQYTQPTNRRDAIIAVIGQNFAFDVNHTVGAYVFNIKPGVVHAGMSGTIEDNGPTSTIMVDDENGKSVPLQRTFKQVKDWETILRDIELNRGINFDATNDKASPEARAAREEFNRLYKSGKWPIRK